MPIFNCNNLFHPHTYIMFHKQIALVTLIVSYCAVLETLVCVEMIPMEWEGKGKGRGWRERAREREPARARSPCHALHLFQFFNRPPLLVDGDQLQNRNNTVTYTTATLTTTSTTTDHILLQMLTRVGVNSIYIWSIHNAK